MSVFLAVRDNPVERSLINVYCDGVFWGNGECDLDTGICKVPVRNKEDRMVLMVANSLATANQMLNKYQGLTKSYAREYLKVSKKYLSLE